MSWQGIEGHDKIVERFQTSIAAGRLGSAFLFVGPGGIGKRLFATKLAQSLFCQATDGLRLDPCNTCPACVQVLAGSHPDLDVIEKPSDRSFIPIQLLIGDKNRRMREGLVARIALRPSEGNRKVAIIDDADYLNQEGANSMLKTLEEPPAGSVLILIGTSPQRQLPTIRSRCQIIPFSPLPIDTCARIILDKEWVDDLAQATSLAEISRGSLTAAAQWNDPDLWEFRSGMLKSLTATDWDAVSLAKTTVAFVKNVSKETQQQRIQLRMIIDVVIDYYAQAMRYSAGGQILGDEKIKQHAARLVDFGHLDSEGLAACLERSQQARIQVDANANVATLIESWIDDIAQLNRNLPVPHAIPW